MVKQIFSSLWARKRRLLGGSVAVVIGVAFLAATLILSDGMKSGISDLMAEGNSGTDAYVRNEIELSEEAGAARAPFDESIVDQLAELDQVDTALPVVEGIAQIVGADGEPIGGDGPPTFGTNWLDFDRNPYVLVDGQPPRAAGEVVIDSDSAEEGDLAVGDTITVLAPGPIDATLVGIAELRSGEALGGVTFTWFDTETAQELLLGGRDAVTGVNLTAADGTSPEELAAVVDPLLPEGLEAVTGDTLTDEDNDDIAADFLNFFEGFLLVFAGIAVLVATFTIHNTLSIVVVQRTRESALLRALGASRRQVLTAVVVESLMVGVVASAIGMFAGVGLANGLKALLDSMGFGIPTATLGLDQGTVIASFVVGVGVTLVACLGPAIKASRVAPLAALRDVEVDRSGRSIVRAVFGTLVTAGGVALVVLAPETPDSAMSRTGLGALLTVVGFVMVGPAVARLAAGVLGAPIAAVGGYTGRLGRRNAMRNPRRTAGTASALMLGTAVVAVFASFAASIKQSIDDLVADTYEGDLVVVQEGWGGVGLDPELASEIGKLPEVSTSTGLAFANITVDGELASETFVIDPPAVAEVVDLDVQAGALEAVDRDGLAVGTEFAEDHGWQLGSTVEVGYPDGTTETKTVQAVFEQANLLGELLMHEAAWLDHSARTDDFIVLIEVADGYSVDDARAAIAPVTERYAAPDAQDRDEYLAAETAEIDQLLGLIYGLLGLAILIALLGIANTLSLSLHERTRELGLLRAVGQTRTQLRRTVRWESIIIAVFGTVGGLALGTFLGWGLMRSMVATEGFGTFVAPVSTLVVVVVAAIVAGVLAAARPARRAAKLDVLQAIATT